MDEKRIAKARKALDSDLAAVKHKKGYREEKITTRERKRLSLAIAISFSVTALLAFAFIFLSSSGEPPDLSIEEQKILIDELDGLYWECSDRDELCSMFSIDCVGDISTEKRGDSELVLSLGTLSIPFTLSDDGLSAKCGRVDIHLLYSEGRNGKGRTITIRSPSSSVQLFLR